MTFKVKNVFGYAIPPKNPPTRIGPIGVELVTRNGAFFANVHHNGTVHSSHKMDHEMTMPEALVWLATLIRMGDIQL